MKCPKCKQPLQQIDRRFVCSANHSYDIAKEGYVNLLLKNSQNHGDNKQMVAARSHFLNQGYYKPLADEIVRIVNEVQNNQNNGTQQIDITQSMPELHMLDLGCGQGYYTNFFQQAFEHASIIGIDISKEAVTYASKQNKKIQYIVASNASLPLADKSIDVAFCLFSFVDYEETRRVLQDDGILIVVNPHEKHLYELKQAVYETPYLNDVKVDNPSGYELVNHSELTYPFHVSSQQAIKELFAMTPYSYKTRKEDADKLDHIDELALHASFSILVYRKK